MPRLVAELSSVSINQSIIEVKVGNIHLFSGLRGTLLHLRRVLFFMLRDKRSTWVNATPYSFSPSWEICSFFLCGSYSKPLPHHLVVLKYMKLMKCWLQILVELYLVKWYAQIRLLCQYVSALMDISFIAVASLLGTYFLAWKLVWRYPLTWITEQRRNVEAPQAYFRRIMGKLTWITWFVLLCMPTHILDALGVCTALSF